MDIEQIKAFIHVSSTGSFSKTAEYLFISQPTVSAKIKTLEEEVGNTLFERNKNYVYLSESGKAFLPYAYNILNNANKGRDAIKKTNSNFKGELAFAIFFSGSSYILPKIVENFNKQYPEINLVTLTGHSNQVVDMVLHNQVSVGIVRSTYHPYIESLRLFEDEMVLTFHPEHYFNTLSELTIEDLAQSHMVLFKRETLDWELINNAFQRINLTPKVIVEADSVEGAKQMVKKQIGFLILPKFSIRKELESNILCTAPIKNMPKIKRDFQLIYLKEKSFNETTENFINFIVKFLKKI